MITSDYNLKFKIEPAEDEDEEDLENNTRVIVNELIEIAGITNVSFITKEEKISMKF
jgi:hypothetical protein